MKTPSAGGPTLVVGLGNPLMTDDGIGLAALERLRARWRPPAESGVEYVDGGTWGLFLLPEIERAGAVIFLDAIQAGEEPGAVIELSRDEIPAALSVTGLSVHQLALADLIALASLRGTLPERTAAIGIQPLYMRMGTEVTPEAEAALDDVVERTLARLAAWGHPIDDPALEGAGESMPTIARAAACTR
ncbi:MAG: hydrogenase maturation protease [Gemmatimonadota bacterium]|nr:hydrogenase maturation protease [Gemmatimonadota bacterium]